MRYSGTQALCRVMVESPSPEKTEAYCRQIAKTVKLNTFKTRNSSTDCDTFHGSQGVNTLARMRYVLLFLVLVVIILWVERLYWKRSAQFLELRVLKKDRSRFTKSMFDAWLDGRIEARIQRKKMSS